MTQSNEKTYTITGGPLAAHEYIVVKREMNAADDAWITNHSAAISGDKKNPTVALTLGDIKLATLKRMIVSWNRTELDEKSGQQVPVPLSETAIEELPRRVSAYVNKVIADLNPDDEEDLEAFTNAAGASSAGSSTGMKKGR